MATHMLREIERLKKQILALSAIVEESVRKAVTAISERNVDLAREVLQGDAGIDRMEIDVEEDCLKILALYQPVAGDLRLLVAVLKINNDLERIGDLAVNIGKRAIFLSERADIGIPFDFGEMCRRTLDMLRHSLDALMTRNARLAHQVLADDDAIDRINKAMYEKISGAVQKSPQQVDVLLSYLSASRHLERIADYGTNIAEDVIYMVEGGIVRHGGAMEGDR